MRCLVSCLFFIFLIDCLSAQQGEQDSLAHLSFKLNADSFLKNNEYFSPHTDGFTGIGVILQPHVKYHIDCHSSFLFGYHFLKYAGLNSFSEAIPLITFQTSFYKGWSLLFGSINGGAKHKLSEPLYRIDNDYQNQIEYGIQSLFDYDWLTADLWLQWEQFIKKDDPFPEEVYAGNTIHLRLKKFRLLEFYLDSEILVSHLGGQIDADDNPDRTIVNYSIGPSMNFKAHKDLLVTLKYLYYKSSVVKQVADPNSLFYIPFETGDAHYPQLLITHKSLNLTIGYWSSNSFISPRGEFLFSSLSDKDPKFFKSSRHLLTNILSFTSVPFSYLNLSVFGGTYFDTIRRRLDYTYGLRAFVTLESKIP